MLLNSVLVDSLSVDNKLTNLYFFPSFFKKGKLRGSESLENVLIEKINWARLKVFIKYRVSIANVSVLIKCRFLILNLLDCKSTIG